MIWQTAAAAAGAVGNYFSSREANKTNMAIANQATATNIAEAQKNRDFQEEMSNTAYQRSMADMKSAGLNPMLAYSNGGANTPGGAQGSAQMAHVDSQRLGDTLSEGVNTAIETRRLKKEIDAVDSQVDLNKQQKATAEAQEILLSHSADKVFKEAQKTDVERAAMELQLPSINAKSLYDVKDITDRLKNFNYDSKRRRIGETLDTVRGATGAIGDILGGATKSMRSFQRRK